MVTPHPAKAQVEQAQVVLRAVYDYQTSCFNPEHLGVPTQKLVEILHGWDAPRLIPLLCWMAGKGWIDLGGASGEGEVTIWPEGYVVLRALDKEFDS